MTNDQELLKLAQQLLDAAHYCTQLEKLEDHCREVARKLEAIAERELPQSPNFKEIERILTDYFDTAGADVESQDGEWFIYVNDDEGKVSLTELAVAVSRPDRGGK